MLGGGGFIGGQLGKALKDDGYLVIAVDIKPRHEFFDLAEHCAMYKCRDLRNKDEVDETFTSSGEIDEIFQLAADMGGAGFVFTGDHDADIMRNSALINLNVLDAASRFSPKARIFYSSSACAYPQETQTGNSDCHLSESMAYPANPDSCYGWEKLFSEIMYAAYARNYGLDVRVARLHNVFGPCGSFEGGREKAPAAVCRKVALAEDGGEIEIWGDGEQQRSFLYISDCVRAVRRLMGRERIDFGPINIGSEEMVTINGLVRFACRAAGKTVRIKHVPGPQGVRARCSDNRMVERELGWRPEVSLGEGMRMTYEWIAGMLGKEKK